MLTVGVMHLPARMLPKADAGFLSRLAALPFRSVTPPRIASVARRLGPRRASASLACGRCAACALEWLAFLLRPQAAAFGRHLFAVPNPGRHVPNPGTQTGNQPRLYPAISRSLA